MNVTSEAMLQFGMARTDGAADWVNLNSAQKLTPNKWHHAVATYDGSHMRLYVNGVLSASVYYIGGFGSCGSTAYIGSPGPASGYGNTRRFSGRLDEMALYNQALDPSTIADRYELLAPDQDAPFEINPGMKTVRAAPGDEVWLPIYLANYEDYPISSCTFTLLLDTSIVTFRDISVPCPNGRCHTQAAFSGEQAAPRRLRPERHGRKSCTSG